MLWVLNNGLVLLWGQHTSPRDGQLNVYVTFPINLNNIFTFSTSRDICASYQSSTGTVHFNSMHVDCALANRVSTSGFYFSFMNTGYDAYYLAIGNLITG